MEVVAILAKNGKLISIGYKNKKVHAEINACRKAKKEASGAIMYIIGAKQMNDESLAVMKASGVDSYILCDKKKSVKI